MVIDSKIIDLFIGLGHSEEQARKAAETLTAEFVLNEKVQDFAPQSDTQEIKTLVRESNSKIDSLNSKVNFLQWVVGAAVLPIIVTSVVTVMLVLANLS